MAPVLQVIVLLFMNVVYLTRSRFALECSPNCVAAWETFSLCSTLPRALSFVQFIV